MLRQCWSLESAKLKKGKKNKHVNKRNETGIWRIVQDVSAVSALAPQTKTQSFSAIYFVCAGGSCLCLLGHLPHGCSHRAS